MHLSTCKQLYTLENHRTVKSFGDPVLAPLKFLFIPNILEHPQVLKLQIQYKQQEQIILHLYWLNPSSNVVGYRPDLRNEYRPLNNVGQQYTFQ